MPSACWAETAQRSKMFSSGFEQIGPHIEVMKADNQDLFEGAAFLVRERNLLQAGFTLVHALFCPREVPGLIP
jgi:hypothetical protein